MIEQEPLPPHLLDLRHLDIGISVTRAAERQRALRKTLPAQADCWAYADLIDIVYVDPATERIRFTGFTISEWARWLRGNDRDRYREFVGWFENIMNGQRLAVMHRLPRIPRDDYTVEVARPTFGSILEQKIQDLPFTRASVQQWRGTLVGFTRRGLRSEELEESGVLARLNQKAHDAMLSRDALLDLVDLAPTVPRIKVESRFGFVARAGWREVCERIDPTRFHRHGLPGRGYGAVYVIRFRHRSLGWMVVRARYRDLLTEGTDWWTVLDERGKLLFKSLPGFATADQAMAYAETRMSQAFRGWGKNQVAARWQRYSLTGGHGYREILFTLDDWPDSYYSPHFGARNVLIHLRFSVRRVTDGRQVVFLDEVQSDWSAEASRAKRSDQQKVPPPPFSRDWVTLALKFMLWWAQRLKVSGVAWSTPELQRERWPDNSPPLELYRKELPKAAHSLARALEIKKAETTFSIRASGRTVERSPRGWLVLNAGGAPITKAFPTRDQAEHFADLTTKFREITVPVLWIDTLAPIRRLPLYGVGDLAIWHKPEDGGV